MSVAAGVLQELGAILGIWGLFWYAWDHHATVPGVMLVLAVVLLVLGNAGEF